MFKVAGYEKGSDIHVLNVMTLNSRPVGENPNGTKKWAKRRLFTVYRDNQTGAKRVDIVDNPISETYITKPEFKNEWNTRRKAVPYEKVDKYAVPYDDLPKFVYDKIKEYNTDGWHSKDKELFDTYNEAFETRQNRLKKEVFKWRHAYYSDYDICDYVLTQAITNYKPSRTDISKSYLDIEVDVYQSTKQDREEARRPIIAITLAFTHDKHGVKMKRPLSVQLYLRNYSRYKGQKEIEDNQEEYLRMLDEKYGEDFDYPKHVMRFYDDERELITDAMGLIHMMKADYCGIYNMPFDIGYITKRAFVLGMNGEALFHHPDFGDEYLYYYYKDKKNEMDIPNNADAFDCSSYTKYYCIMRAYARRRKHLSDYGGNALDNVAEIELGYGKAHFKDPTTDVINAPIRSWKEFAEYSFKDTMLLYKLEIVCYDLDAIHDQSIHSGCRFNKTLNASYSAKTDFDISYMDDLKIVPGNNTNATYRWKTKEEMEMEEPDPLDFDKDNELAGAVVADPDLNAFNGLEINGRPSNRLFGNVLYLDFEALYPNCKIKFQLAEDLQYFRVIIEKQVLPIENPLNDSKWLSGGQFIEDYESKDWCKIGRWFKLPDISECVTEFRELVSRGEIY